MEVELMVTKRDDDRPTTDRVNIEQSATGRLEGRVLQKLNNFVPVFPQNPQCTVSLTWRLSRASSPE